MDGCFRACCGMILPAMPCIPILTPWPGEADLAAERLELKNIGVLAEEQEYKDGDGTVKVAGIGRVGVIGEEILLQELCTKIKKKFGVQVLNVYASENKMDSYISKVAIVPWIRKRIYESMPLRNRPRY